MVMKNLKILGMIPARFQSRRFPGKLLAEILGKSLLQRTYENARRSKRLDDLVIATDDERILNHAKSFGAKVLLTSSQCLTGTDRLAEAIKKYPFESEIIVNIQGDEPCLNPEVIDRIVDLLVTQSEAAVTTAVVKINDEESILNPSVVKCVFDQKGKALYFSRSPIPYVRGGDVSTGVYYRHLGIYAYRKGFLLQYSALAPTPLQKMEDLEQLKVLETGFPIYISVVQDEGIGVDNPEDVQKVEALLCRQNTFS